MADTAIVVSEEQQELLNIQKKLDTYPKLRQWLFLFLDKSNKNTYGNKTRSALIAYGLDEKKQYYSAARIGFENYQKLKIVASAYYDADGMTTAKVLDLIAVHAVAGKPKALEMLATITGVYDPKAAQITINNTQNNQTTITTVKADDPRIAQVNKDFQEFIEAKYAKKPKIDDGSEGV